MRPAAGLAKEDGESSYSLLTNLNSKAHSPVQLYKPQGVGYYYTNNKVESDDTSFVHAISDDWEKKWKKEVTSSLGGLDINQIKDVQDTFHASARKLPTDSVFTVLFTEEQTKLYKQYGGNCIYMDATHSLTQYGYYVISLGVEDVNGNGRIVGYCITDSTDANHVTAFLESVKKAAPEIEPSVIVTDDDNAEWSAVKKVFPHIKRFLCQFHVRKSWGLNLNKCGAKGEVFKTLQDELQVLIAECDEDLFNVQLAAFKEKSRDLCVSFHQYFVSNWCTPERISMWAQFPRDQKNMNDVTTNNYIESYHNILKNDPRYFDKKANKRFDKLILVLLQHESDQNGQLEYVQLFGTLLRNDRRKDALIGGKVIVDSEVRLVQSCGTQHSFAVRSQSDANREYQVSFNKQCSCGFSNEVWCNHSFTCTCPVFKKRHRPCKHVGAVFRIHKQLFQGIPTFKPANTATVSYLGDVHAVAKRVVARLDRMVKEATNLAEKLTTLKTAVVEQCSSQQKEFASSTANVSLLRKLDAVDHGLRAACNCADVTVIAPIVTVVVPALVPIVNVAPGSHFIKQTLFRTHEKCGRKKNPALQPVSAEHRLIVANAMSARGTALLAGGLSAPGTPGTPFLSHQVLRFYLTAGTPF